MAKTRPTIVTSLSGGLPLAHRFVAGEGPGERPGAVGRRAQVDRVADQLAGRHVRTHHGHARRRCPGRAPGRAARPGRSSPCRPGRRGPCTSTSSYGSRSTTPAVSAASRSASAPALWKAMSEESTLCALPPVSVTRTSTIGWPAQPRSIWARMPFSTDGMNCRGTTPPTTRSANSNPEPAGERLDLDLADGVLAVAAGLLHVPAERRCRGAARVSRIGTTTSTWLTETPNRSDSRSRAASACASPIVQSTSWPDSPVAHLDPQRRVLGGQPGQRGRQLVLVGLGRGLDRHRQQRRRQRPRPQHPRVLDRGERVAGLRPGQPADRGDVAADHPAAPAAALAERVGQRADPLVVVVVGVARLGAEERREVSGHVHRPVRVEGAGEDPDQADPADVRVARGLHDLGDERPVRVARHRRRRPLRPG